MSENVTPNSMENRDLQIGIRKVTLKQFGLHFKQIPQKVGIAQYYNLDQPQPPERKSATFWAIEYKKHWRIQALLLVCLLNRNLP